MSTTIDIEITPEISEEIRQEFIKRLDDRYYLTYIDYRDSLDNHAETIQECLNKDNGDKFFEEINDALSDSTYEAATYAVNQIKDGILNDNSLEHLHDFIDEWFDTDDNELEIRQMIEERDESTPIEDLIKNTSMRARATLHTNYDCLLDNWSLGNTYSYSEYFKDIIDVLYLNPAEVKKTFIKKGINVEGSFPNLAYRNGKEAVSYDDFAQELLNQCCYGLLTFAGMLPLDDICENHFGKITHITIPKDNYCGMFSDWNGGGSLMEMKLLRDLKVPVSWARKTKYDSFDLSVDEPKCDGYCIDEVYGLVSSFWNKPLQLAFTPTT